MIEVRDVSLTLGEFHLRDIDLLVDEGEYAVILGPTGAGKTVLLECIVGIHEPARGQVVLDQRDVTRMRPEQRGVAYVPQDYCLFPHMTVFDNIAFGMRLRKWPSGRVSGRVDELARLLHIEPILGRRPLTLSGGERQRAALARALAVEPRVLLLDEPLSAVDERTRERLCDELKAVQRHFGTTTVHVSHNFEETLAVADKVAVFERGRIAQVGTPEDVFCRPNSVSVALFVGITNLLPGAVRPGDGLPEFISGGLRFAVDTGLRGPAVAAIRPENIHLLAADEAHPDILPSGRVARLTDKGALVKVAFTTAGVDLVALASKREVSRLRIEPGAEVAFEVSPHAVHLLPGDGGDAAFSVEGPRADGTAVV